MNVRDVAARFDEWARATGALVETRGFATGEARSLRESLDLSDDVAEETEKRLTKNLIVGVLVDEPNHLVTILTKGRVGPRIVKGLPDTIGNVKLAYIGGVAIGTNPPDPVPPDQLGSQPCWLYQDTIACGSSITVSHVHAAGTLGALVTDKKGKLYGLTNNHVTGDCNHTVKGMYVLSPSPMDARPSGPPPRSIGCHSRFVPLQSGDPQQVVGQELDAAIFEIEDPALVSSMQGGGRYDTPNKLGLLTGGRPIKKFGRTTAETFGEVVGKFLRPVPVVYKSSRFSSVVYFRDVVGIKGTDQGEFSQPGDSGSLVVSADGTEALGLLFGGGDGISLVTPLGAVLNAFEVSLVSKHNV